MGEFQFLKLVSEEKGWVGALIIACAYAVYTLSGVAKRLLEAKGMRLIESDEVSCPTQHRFFSLASSFVQIRLKQMNVYAHGSFCPVRTLIFRDMLSSKFSAWSDEIRSSVTKLCQKSNVKNSEIADEMAGCVARIVGAYSLKWAEAGIPDQVVEKFHSWHFSRSESLREVTSQIAHGNSFHSKKEKLNAILEIHSAMLYETVNDAERTFGVLNGELSGTKYGKLTIE